MWRKRGENTLQVKVGRLQENEQQASAQDTPKKGAKDAAASKAGPAPAKGTLNTPEADKVLKQQKGQ